VVSKDFIDQIRALIEGYPHDQTQLAEAWRGRMNARPGAQPIPENTPPTRLSGLRNGKLDGVKYFFKDRSRATPLLDLLEIHSDEEREALLLAAEAYLDAHDSSRPRLIVLLALWGEALPEGLWARLRRWLEAPKTPHPIVLCVNDEQWDRVPRSLDEIRGLTVKRAEADEARAMAQKTAARGGLVAASEWGLVPYERWLAVDFAVEAEVLACAPKGWRERYAEEGQLDALPVPARRLETLDFKADGAPARYPKGLHLRAHLAKLASGEGAPSPAQRLAQGEALGITAGATAEEVAAFEAREEDHRLNTAAKAADLEVEVLSSKGLQARLERAQIRPLQAVCRVEDHWHWINLEPPEKFQAHPRVKHYSIDAPEPALERLWQQVKDWTLSELAADPMLHGAVEALDPEGAEQAAFNLARAWILEGDREDWPAAPAPTAAPALFGGDSMEAMEATLKASAVEARLRLVERGDEPHWTRADELLRWQDPKIGIFHTPPRGDLELCRDQELVVIYGQQIITLLSKDEIIKTKRPLDVDFIPLNQGLNAESLDTFCDQLIIRLDPEIETRFDQISSMPKAWDFLTKNCVSYYYYNQKEWDDGQLGQSKDKVEQIKAFIKGSLPHPDNEPDWFSLAPIRSIRKGEHQSEEIFQHPQLWHHIDHFIAQLRRCLQQRLTDAAALPDGALLIPLRDGVEAHVVLRNSNIDAPQVIIEASIREDLEELTWETLRSQDSKLEINKPWRSLGVSCPSDLPEAVELHAKGVCVRVTFMPDLLEPQKPRTSLKCIESSLEDIHASFEAQQLKKSLESIESRLENIYERLRYV